MIMGKYYILEGHKVVETALLTWAKWFEGTEHHMADENVGDIRVSTAFLGLDHSFGYGPPLFFETMVFGGSLDQEQDRYTTWEEAEAGHKAMVKRVKEAIETGGEACLKS